MDEAAQGIAKAALTPQSVVLHALVHKGVLTREDALGIVHRSQDAAANVPSAEAAGKAVVVTQNCLAGAREGLAAMAIPQR